jgi:hypothetical protein
LQNWRPRLFLELLFENQGPGWNFCQRYGLRVSFLELEGRICKSGCILFSPGFIFQLENGWTKSIAGGPRQRGRSVEWAENGSAGPDGGWAATKEKPGKIIRNGVGCKVVLGQK